MNANHVYALLILALLALLIALALREIGSFLLDLFKRDHTPRDDR